MSKNELEDEQNKDTVEYEIKFIQCEQAERKRFYCHKCFYHFNKKLMNIYPKPADTKCLIGRIGYYKAEKKMPDFIIPLYGDGKIIPNLNLNNKVIPI